MKSTRIEIVTVDSFEIEDGCITWVGSQTSWQDNKGKKIPRPKNLPSEHNLMIHKLGKELEGKNGDDELAIVGYI